METNILTKTINNAINQRILDTHTNFMGKIISTNLNLMTVQPLQMYKVYGKEAQMTSVISNIPILIPYKYVYLVNKGSNKLIDIVQREIEVGDVVYCGVCERDITEAKNGKVTTSSTGRHHSLSDSVAIMGISVIEYVEAE